MLGDVDGMRCAALHREIEARLLAIDDDNFIGAQLCGNCAGIDTEAARALDHNVVAEPDAAEVKCFIDLCQCAVNGRGGGI